MFPATDSRTTALAEKKYTSFGKWLGIIGLLFIFVALRWNSFDAPLTRDEGEYLYAARLLEQGIAPYDQAFLQKPPMIVYTYALADLLWPESFWSARFLAMLFAALATGVFAWIASEEFGGKFSLAIAWLVTPLILLPEVDQFTANTEVFLLLPLMGTVAIYRLSCQREPKASQWFTAGFLGSITFFYKYTMLPLLFFVFATWLIEIWIQTKKPSRLFRSFVAAMVGGIVAAILALGFFLLHDGGATWWDCTVRFNGAYVQTAYFGMEGFWQQIKTLGTAWWILFLLPFGALFEKPSRFWFWFGLFGCAVVATGGSPFGHYFIPVMPFWALLACVGIHSLALHLANLLQRSPETIFFTLTAAVVIAVLSIDVPWLMISSRKFAEKKFAQRSPFMEAPMAAIRIVQLTSSNELVLVAGSEPEILCYAHRLNSTRFITAYSLVIPSLMKQRYQEQAIRDLQRRPSVIVLARSWLQDEDPPSPYLVALQNLLVQEYKRIGGAVFDGQTEGWAEPLTDDAARDSRIVVYQRKDRVSGK